jgi:hypothetical protein
MENFFKIGYDLNYFIVRNELMDATNYNLEYLQVFLL